MFRFEQTNRINQCPLVRVSKAWEPKSIVRFFRQSPMMGVDLNLERDRDPGRDIENDVGTLTTDSDCPELDD